MKQSAGILLYRKNAKGIEVLIVHPGGPFWAKKDKNAWSIPKGEFVEGEEVLAAAKREFTEEVGLPAPEGDYRLLGQFKQPSGKIVHAFVLEADLNLANFKSNLFEMQWPPKSGQVQSFPEADKAIWASLAQAQSKLVRGQLPLLGKLVSDLGLKIEEYTADNAQASLF